MSRIFAAIALWALPLALALAGPLFPLPVGQDLTLAGSSHPRTVQSAANNPAAPVTSDLGGFWFGLGGVGVGYEAGAVDNLMDQFDALEEDLDREDLTQSEAEALRGKSNAFLQQLGDKGYVKVFANAQPPLLPVGGSGSALGGALTFGAVAFTGARVAVLADDVNVAPSASVPGAFELRTDTAGYGKAAAGAVVSLGYSGGVHHRDDGSLFMGARLNHYTVELVRGVVRLEDEGDAADDDTEDSLEDEFDRDRVRSTALGLDVGALWAAHNFRAGLTVRNLNEPDFNYNALGQNCPAKAGAARRNCEAAAQALAAGRIPVSERYTLERQIQLETAVFTANRTWSLAATYDVDAARDATGDDYQWLAVSAAFSPGGSGWLAPALRMGYRQNQTGSALDMLSLGLSLFRLVNVDLSASTQSVKDGGDDAPRSAMASVSLELFF